MAEKRTVTVKKTTAMFYDLRTKSKITAPVTEKGTDGIRHWFKGVTPDGRVLSLLVSKEKWKAAK